MFLLDPQKYQNLTKLIPNDFPDRAVLMAILENKLPAEVWVDDVNNPAACLINSFAPVCFILGNIKSNLYKQFLKKLSSKFRIRLVYENFHANFIYGLTSIKRLLFKFVCKDNYVIYPNTSDYVLINLNKDTPEIIKHCVNFRMGRMLYSNEEECIKNAWGMALLDKKNNKIACEVFGIASAQNVEISIFTYPHYRKQGLAKILGSHFIQEILNSNKEPIWACDKSNTNSVKLAKSLGFEYLREYEFKIFIKEALYALILHYSALLKKYLT